MAVNVFVFYCPFPPSRLPLTRPPTLPPFSQVYFPGHSSLAAKAFAYVDLESERTAPEWNGGDRSRDTECVEVCRRRGKAAASFSLFMTRNPVVIPLQTEKWLQFKAA